MAYITNANFNRIFKDVSELIEVNPNSSVYPDLDEFCGFFFNKKETNELLQFKEFVKDPDFYIEQYYDKTFESPFSHEYLNLDGKKPAYHADFNCKLLHNVFVGLKIPEEIKEEGYEAIEKFKLFYKEREDLYYHDKEAFEAQASIRFKKKIEIYEDIRPNSGEHYFRDIKIEDIKAKIIKLWEDLKEWVIKDGINSDRSRVYNAFRKKTFMADYEEIPNNLGLSDNRIREILHTLHYNFKKPLIGLLKDYYMISINPEIKLEGKILENLGFVPCRKCCNLS